MSMKTKNTFITLAILAFVSTLSLAQVPDTLNYQGVLRDAAGDPLTTSVDMVFTLYSAEVAGDEVLLDRHLNINGQAVTVDTGLFDVLLGSGEVLDGAGIGTYLKLSDAFRDYSNLWLEVQVGAETLAPRTPLTASGYALNSKFLGGKTAGDFVDTTSADQAKAGRLTVGTGGTSAWGIESYGTDAAGYFVDSNDSGYAFIAEGDTGVLGYGDVRGGYFRETGGGTAETSVATGNEGIVAAGSVRGGHFRDTDSTGYAYVGVSNDGIQGYGSLSGGYFSNSLGSGWGEVGASTIGVRGFGDEAGGYFQDGDGSSYSYLGYGTRGLEAYGITTGGYFESLNFSAFTAVASGNIGIQANGDTAGGWFTDLNSSSWAYVGFSTYKIQGSGTVSFRQNHPVDSSKSIVYHAPESSEVGVYTRGSARLDNGMVRIPLDDTFEWVTNPDIGLTAHLTPRSSGADLYVSSVTSTELVVEGAGDADFDYMVWGLRVGFEELAPIQEKTEEAYIPSMKDHRDLYVSNPELREYNALQRFTNQRLQLAGTDVSEIDFSRSRELIANIGEFDPEIHTVQTEKKSHPQQGQENRAERDVQVSSGRSSSTADELNANDREQAPVVSSSYSEPAARSTFPIEKSMDRAVSGEQTWLPVGEDIGKGAVLALDPDQPGFLRLATDLADTNIVGIAADAARPNAEGQLEVMLADQRYVTVNVDAGYGAIEAGDMLQVSPTEGHAMRATHGINGMILGKAIESHDDGVGRIRMLLLLQY